MTAHDLPPLPDGLRALLDSASAGAPPVPPGIEQQVLGQLSATLGAAGAVGAAATAATSASGGAAAGATAGVLVVVAKPLAALVVAAAIGGGLYAASRMVLARPAPSAVQLLDAERAPAVGVAPHVERWAPITRPVDPAATRARASGDAGVASNDVDEPALLERARAALARGDGDTALIALVDHERRFPRGLLVEERRALTVVAFRQQGDTERASAGARQFARQHPDSIFLEMVRRAAGER